MYGSFSPDFIVRCVEVKSGDTIVVEDQTGTRKTVRLHGIDAPEKGHPHDEAATEAARNAVEGKRVEIDVVNEDRSGRVVGRVRAGRTRLGPHLLRNGHVWHDRRQARGAAPLATLQEDARTNSRGLWARDNPVPPWEHRGRSSDPGATAWRLVELALSFVRGRSNRDEPVVRAD